ncbi:MAG TPA: hypothetical protein RMH99_04675 [Sandaracinaceae bacterium LLY-WYZ-13_1]|nr:hypothetical protein [Sandaracinaceae bacterium LLY-WYZ-13_1]
MKLVAPDGTSPSLLRDTGGAIMLAGTFMAVFLVGMLYYLLGIAESVVLQERLQDAADTSAFEAGVSMARSMNFVSWVHDVMVSLTASLMAGNLLVIAGLVCVEIDALPHGDCERLLRDMEAIEAEITPPIVASLRSASRAQEAVIEAAPLDAADRVATRIVDEHGPLVHDAFLVPHEVPLERQGMGPLCALGNLYQFRLVEITLGRQLMDDLIGRGFPRVGRSLPQCEEVPGAGAFVGTPPDLPVGTEPFQLRVAVIGDTSSLRRIDPAIRIAPSVLGVPSGSESRRDWVDAEPDIDRMLVMAQSEYYSDWEEANLRRDSATVSTEADVFRMRWRGRLRRLRFPTGAPIDTPEARRWRDSWLRETFLPTCGRSCRGLELEAYRATESYH